MSYKIRPGTMNDKSFIYSTFLKGLYYGSEWFSQIDKKTFFDGYGRVLDIILSKPDTVVRMACLPDDEDVILGYLILEGTTVHYAFVKEAWRNKGIAKALLAEDPVSNVTHITKPGNAIRKKMLLTFNPFVI